MGVHQLNGREASGPEIAEGSMRAVVHDQYGDADVLRLAQVPRPSPVTTRFSCRCTRPGSTGASGTS